MPVDDAKRFLFDMVENDQLRAVLNKADSRIEIRAILKDYSYEFSYEELFEAYTDILSNCHAGDHATIIKEVKKWWDLLMFVTPEHEYV